MSEMPTKYLWGIYGRKHGGIFWIVRAETKEEATRKMGLLIEAGHVFKLTWGNLADRVGSVIPTGKSRADLATLCPIMQHNYCLFSFLQD